MARLNRSVGIVKRSGGPAEELQHRDVNFPITIVTSRIDQRANAASGNQHISTPEVAMEKGRGWAGWQPLWKRGRQLFDPVRQARRKVRKMNQKPAFGKECRPVVRKLIGDSY